MSWFQKQKIREIKTERLILPNVVDRFCDQCQIERTFISVEQATFLTNLTSRQIFRLVETNVVHFFETEEGFLFVCENFLVNRRETRQIMD
jgi:hypothetical protein